MPSKPTTIFSFHHTLVYTFNKYLEFSHMRQHLHTTKYEYKMLLEFVFDMKTDVSPYWIDAALYTILQRGVDSENK